MNKHIITISFILLAILVVGILWWLMNFSYQDPLSSSGFKESEKQPVSRVDTGRSWVSKMAQATTRDHHFPVNELYIKLHLQEAIPPKKHIFQLVIDRSDRYSQFCIVQTLAHFSFPYTMVRDKDENRIYINAQNRSLLDDVVKKLKEYTIESTVKEAWL
ncbi:MAG: hypothetical protein GX780_00140 [Campylobacteraceae bacterium]|nr:hypothetical protein [Campylobacteraceae bacterium]